MVRRRNGPTKFVGAGSYEYGHRPNGPSEESDEDFQYATLAESGMEASLKEALRPYDERMQPDPPGGPPTTLYRFFDKDGLLLYVGISVHAPGRIKQHRHDKAWFLDVASATFTHLPTRDEALEAEAVAINTEKPAMNIVVPSLKWGAWKPPGLSAEQMESFQILTRRHFKMEAPGFIDAWWNGEVDRADERLRYVANFIRLLKPEESD